MTVIINQKAPDFKAKIFHNGEFRNIRLSDYSGKWVILFFYPADFTFVCPTELEDLANNYHLFKSLNAEILSVSTDTEFCHKAWHDTSPAIKKINFPMVADPSAKISEEYGTYISDEGLSLRATFIIDPDGVIKAFEMNDNSIGRGIGELLRKLEAAQFTREHGGEVCPVNWKAGDKTLKPGIDLVGKI